MWIRSQSKKALLNVNQVVINNTKDESEYYIHGYSERGIQEGEQFAMLPLTNWYMFDDCFGQIIGLFDEQELNENYIVLTDRPFKLKFEDILEKYHFEDGEIIEND